MLSSAEPADVVSEQIRSAAARLITDNVKVTETLFKSPDTEIIPQRNDLGLDDNDDDQARSLRRRIQLRFSPYAPAMRARVTTSDENKSDDRKPDIAEDTAEKVKTGSNEQQLITSTSSTLSLLRSVRRRRDEIEKEDRARLTHEHSEWDCYRIISGHLGWIRTICFDVNNEWFATGSNDRTIKIWDFASGKLKLTLTGHISSVRSICISDKRPYLFSCGEDKTIKCWDLEQNKVIRTYHGHLSGVYSLCLHPTLDVLCSAGRDCTLRVWDIRTRTQTRVLAGHRDTVNSVISTNVKPHFISASIDSTIRMWDLIANRCVTTLTNHKKSVRQVVHHPAEFSFASAAADNIKTWALPNGSLMRNFNHHQHQVAPDGGKRRHANTLVNCLTCNHDGTLVSGGDDGTIVVWDYPSGRPIQTLEAQVQPGSLECESGVHSLKFDESGSRFISGHVDKTIRMYRTK